VTIAAPPPGSSTAIAAQYEVLRGAALGEVLPINARSGLVVFLRRGMWGWAKALSPTASLHREQICPPAAWSTHAGRSVVVHVLAAIALGIHDRRSA
jgi:hypothetical protein